METGRLARWSLLLQSYQFNVIHRPGKSISRADALSRRMYRETTEEDDTLEYLLDNKYAQPVSAYNNERVSTTECSAASVPDSSPPLPTPVSAVPTEDSPICSDVTEDSPETVIACFEMKKRYELATVPEAPAIPLPLPVHFEHVFSIDTLGKDQDECKIIGPIKKYIVNGDLPSLTKEARRITIESEQL